MFLMCSHCHEPREVWDEVCKKCGMQLTKLKPCPDCRGRSFIDSGDGPEDCPACDGRGCV